MTNSFDKQQVRETFINRIDEMKGITTFSQETFIKICVYVTW